MATQRIITLPIGTIYRSTISRFPVGDQENVILNYDNNNKYLYMDGASSSSTIEGTVTFNAASSYALKMINSTDKIVEITPILTMCVAGDPSTYFNSEVRITLGNYSQKSVAIDSSFSKGVWKQIRLGPFTGSNLSLNHLDGAMMTISIAAPQPIKVSQLCFEIKYETNSYLTTFTGQTGISTVGCYPTNSSPLNIINDYSKNNYLYVEKGTSSNVAVGSMKFDINPYTLNEILDGKKITKATACFYASISSPPEFLSATGIILKCNNTGKTLNFYTSDISFGTAQWVFATAELTGQLSANDFSSVTLNIQTDGEMQFKVAYFYFKIDYENNPLPVPVLQLSPQGGEFAQGSYSSTIARGTIRATITNAPVGYTGDYIFLNRINSGNWMTIGGKNNYCDYNLDLNPGSTYEIKARLSTPTDTSSESLVKSIKSATPPTIDTSQYKLSFDSKLYNMLKVEWPKPLDKFNPYDPNVKTFLYITKNTNRIYIGEFPHSAGTYNYNVSKDVGNTPYEAELVVRCSYFTGLVENSYKLKVNKGYDFIEYGSPLGKLSVKSSSGILSIPYYNISNLGYPIFRINTHKGIAAIPLVSISDKYATNIRVSTPDGIRSLPVLPPNVPITDFNSDGAKIGQSTNIQKSTTANILLTPIPSNATDTFTTEWKFTSNGTVLMNKFIIQSSTANSVNVTAPTMAGESCVLQATISIVRLGGGIDTVILNFTLVSSNASDMYNQN